MRRRAKRTYRRRRTTKRLNDYTKIISIRRTCNINEFTLSGAGNITLGYTFFLTQLPGNAEFIALFQKYRIKYVVVRFYYGANVYDTDQSSVVEQTGFLHLAPDTNDASTPGSVQEMQQYSGYRCIPLQKLQGYSVVIHPTPSLEYYKSVATTAYGTGSRKSWMDCTSSGADCPHFGMKTLIEKSGDPAIKRLRVTAEFCVEFTGIE